MPYRRARRDDDSGVRSRVWHRSSLRAKGLILIAVPLLPLVVLVATLLLQARQDQRVDARITELRRAREAAQLLLATAVDAETGIRGYVPTGNPEFLEPFDAAMANLIGLARTVRVANVPPDVLSLLEQQYDLLITLRRDGPTFPPERQEALLLEGKSNMDRLRAAFAAHDERRQRELEAALATRARLHTRTERILWTGAVGSAVGIAVGVFLFVREIGSRIRLLQENSRLLGGDEPLTPVRGRDEIATLGRVLEATRQELAHREELRQRAEEETIRSRDEAERANAAKSEFLSRMSHELRTPLNAILGFAQLLEMDDLTPDEKENVGHIVGGGRHLLNLINEILDISRVETGRLSISVEPVLLRPLIEETVAMVQPLATADGITVSWDPAAETADAHVMADRQRLKQILLNLLSNGIKYNRPSGSVEIRVSAAGDRVHLAVRDTGPGLDAGQLAQLFTPFERLGAERSGVEGTGLGLALSKGLADAMGARIVASSEVGEGTTFCVDLAAAKDPTDVSGLPADAATVAAGDRTRTVLYIEDNLSNLTLVQTILGRRPDIELLTATDGRSGITAAREHVPDMVLLDLNLPDVDGGHVLRTLRGDPRTASIPVVIVTADATSGQIERFKSAGALDYVTKPLDVRRFLRVVDTALAEAVA